MADIKDYKREKARRSKLRVVKTEDNADLQQKLHRHRLSFFYRILLSVMVCGAIVAIVAVQYYNKTYTDYDVIGTGTFEAVGGTADATLGSHVLTYSKDGARCTDTAGNVIWNQTYEMQSPIVSVCGGVTAIGDYNGRTIYLYNEEKNLGTVSTNLPIRNICVAEKGVVAAVVEDVGVTWIYVYDAAGNELVKFRTTIKDTGYPIAISLSPNALLCTVSYMYVDAGVIKSSVAFYNFDEYGQNQIDNLVGGYDYTDTVVPYVQFMDNRSVFAVGDSSIMFYSGNQKPELLAIYYYEKEIRGVYHNEDYVGVAFYNETGENRYRLEIYDKSGKHVRTQEFNLAYSDIVFDKDTYIIYNDEECLVMTMNGKEKYNGTFKKTVRLLVPGKSSYRYTLVTEDALETIQMK